MSDCVVSTVIRCSFFDRAFGNVGDRDLRVWHGGAVFGFLTAVVLIPDKQVGFSIEINSEDREVVLGLMYELLDHYLDLPKADWPAIYRAEVQRRIAEALSELAKQTARPAAV